MFVDVGIGMLMRSRWQETDLVIDPPTTSAAIDGMTVP
jgi:hypothetical protein